jgi:Podovirus DNA encapsidation protein (Gp16).
MVKMSMYYDYDKLLSRDFLIAFVISERGLGKTFGAKKAVLNRWLKSGGDEEFMYVRRYKTELDTSLSTFWNDIQANGYFEEHDLKVKKNKLLTTFTCDGKVCGYAVPLSTSNILKSTAFPKVKYIIFDEYLLPQGGTYRYLKGEINLFLDLVETTFRLRDGKILMLGNALNVYASPYFAYWDLDIPYGTEFKSYKDGAILVHYARNEVYREKKKQTKFGKLIDGTDYGRYAIDNQDVSINHLLFRNDLRKLYLQVC